MLIDTKTGKKYRTKREMDKTKSIATNALNHLDNEQANQLLNEWDKRIRSQSVNKKMVDKEDDQAN